MTTIRKTPPPIIQDEDIPSKIILGLDYGTTFASGVVCSTSGTPEALSDGKILPFNGYSRSPRTSSKDKRTELPTDIQFESDCIRVGWEATPRRIDEPDLIPSVRIKCAKIGLDERLRDGVTRISLWEDIDALNAFLGSSKDIADVVEEYLTHVFKYFRTQLDRLGYNHLRDFLELNVAVPHIWDQKALRLMVRVLNKAGQRSKLPFGNAIQLWWEPEAAIEYILDKHPRLAPRINDCLMVVDGGGGSTDATPFIVLRPKPQLLLKEAAKGRGVLSGSTDLDELFYEQTRSRLLLHPMFCELDEHALKRILNHAKAEFIQHVKPFFGEEDNSDFNVGIPGLPTDSNSGFKVNTMMIYEEHLKAIFDPVASKVWDLIEFQIQATRENGYSLQRIICVGGLLQSPYLNQFLLSKLENDAIKAGLAKPIELHTPHIKDFSIAYGAVACSLRTVDQSIRRINRSSVGFCCNQIFNSKKPGHRAAGPSKRLDETDNKTYVWNCIDWLLKKDEEQQECVGPIKMTRTVPGNGEGTYSLAIELYVSDSSTESSFPLDHEKNKDCELWEEIIFDFDMEAVRQSHKPIEKRAPKKRKTVSKGAAQEPTRKSERIRSKLPTLVENPEDTQLSEKLQDFHIAHKSRSDSRRLETRKDNHESLPTTPQSESLPGTPWSDSDAMPVSLDDGSQDIGCFYEVEFFFEMKFKGLLSSYTINCPVLNREMPGTVNLAAFYKPGTR